MRAFISLLGLLIFYLPGSKNDLGRQGLKGRVKSVTDCQCPVNKEGKIDTANCTVFVFRYDESGRLYEDNDYVNGSIYRGFSQLNHKHLYKYDDTGNQVEVDEYNPDGSMNQKVLYRYDQRGNRIERDNYLKNGMLWHRSVYTFNDKDQQTECSKYNADSALIEHYSYAYDAVGHMQLEQHVVIRSKSGEGGKKITFTPQNPERLIDYIKTFAYDDSGLMIKETDNFSNFPYPLESSYKYGNFDASGNWLKQTTYQGSGAAAITERVIEYY